MKNITFLFILTTLLLASCSKDMVLRESIFIEDPDYPGLPKYTEWGYNTFGVYLDNGRFVSDDAYMPIKIITQNDTTRFLFRGRQSSHYDYSPMSMTLIIPGFNPQVTTDLLILNDSLINLKDQGCRLIFDMDGSISEPPILNGNFHFKRAQNLLVDNEQQEVILSGTFEFQLMLNNEPVACSEGRFDFGIGYQNFFSF